MDLCVRARMSPSCSNPTTVVRGRSTLKQMVACFFGNTGHVATAPLEHRRTVNSEWYTRSYLPKVFGEIRQTNKRRRIIVHHDNACSHTSAQNSAFLTGQHVELMGHLLYSPDLAPSDFFLFPHIKKKFVVNDFRRQKMLLKRSKTMFWRCLNRSGKTDTNYGRASKHSEWDYAKKCQIFLGEY